MKPNQIYFYRNRGSWDFQIKFQLKSWGRLWGTDIPLVSKFIVSGLIVMQKMMGSLRMGTHVDFQESKNVVSHSTKMKLKGVTVYRCEKNFHLNNDGNGIRLEGVEYFWPLNFIAFPFKPTTGTVENSTTRAFYQMPLAGTLCSCHIFMELPMGYVYIETPWIEGRFTLTDESNKKLEARLKEI